MLSDGRVIYEGGEYNLGTDGFTNLGAIYDPVANTWESVAPPPFIAPNKIGDACSVVLNDGTFMLQIPATRQAALLNASTLGWTETGTSTKFDRNAEEGWVLLPNGKVLTVDCYDDMQGTPYASRTNSELYDPNTGTWSSAGSTINSLTDPGIEVGASVLRPDGTVFALGASGYVSIYDSDSNTWSAGLSLTSTPSQQGCEDAPAALLPNGNVLFATCNYFPVNNGFPPTRFFEFDGVGYTEQPATPQSPSFPAYPFFMLVLPTGQVLLACGGSNDVEIYTPADTSHNAAWEPIIYCVPRKVCSNNSYQATGALFNGMSQAGMYGDDYQCATNYPLVRITNNATGHVFYCRTHDHINAATGLPFMGVAAPNVAVATTFDVPATVELGASTLEVIANGIPSQPVSLIVLPATH